MFDGGGNEAPVAMPAAAVGADNRTATFLFTVPALPVRKWSAWWCQT